MLASGSVTEEDYESVADDPYFLGVIGPGNEIEHEAGAEMAEYFIHEKQGNPTSCSPEAPASEMRCTTPVPWAL